MTEAVSKNNMLSPERIVQSFGLKSGDHVGDFGVGHGYFTIPLGRAVGTEGKVYAFDIMKNMIEVVRAKARLEHLLNIEYIWADLEQERGSRLKDAYLDFVFMGNILFQTEKKENLFKEAARILGTAGRLAVVEWEPSAEISLGPPNQFRITREAVINAAANSNFTLDREFDAGAHHFGLIFVKAR